MRICKAGTRMTLSFNGERWLIQHRRVFIAEPAATTVGKVGEYFSAFLRRVPSTSSRDTRPPEGDMSQPDSPLMRSIGLSGVLRWLIAAAAVIAIGAAFADGRYALAIAGVVFLAAAVALGYRARRAR